MPRQREQRPPSSPRRRQRSETGHRSGAPAEPDLRLPPRLPPLSPLPPLCRSGRMRRREKRIDCAPPRTPPAGTSLHVLRPDRRRATGCRSVRAVRGPLSRPWHRRCRRCPSSTSTRAASPVGCASTAPPLSMSSWSTHCMPGSEASSLASQAPRSGREGAPAAAAAVGMNWAHLRAHAVTSSSSGHPRSARFRGILAPAKPESAEGVGFEPTGRFRPPVFKTGSIGRSDSPPGQRC
ncbi:MAG: hypothetical protein JWQ92_2245 [Amnibacterium sp.]|nr:hypothetical protein [Amnibacterium sp.]